MTRVAVALVAAAISTPCIYARSLRAPPAPPPPLPTDDVAGSARLPLIASLTASGGAVVFAIPGARRAVAGLLRRMRGVDELMADEQDDSLDEQPGGEAAAGGAGSTSAGGRSQLVLSPERLSVIAERSSLLTPMSEQLSSVPVFMVGLNHSTTPLSVRAPGGGRLAYFFMEYADADFFRQKIVEQKGEGVEAQVAALSLADLVRAYSSPAAAEAKENFVVIPTMKSVMAARALLKAKGEDETKWDSKLSAASGLVPVFWIQAMASETESGKQRKIMFFSVEDALNMWANVSATQAQTEGGEPPTEVPEILVADLQTLCAHLSEANKTDDVVFAPSSSALRIFARTPTGAGDGDVAAEAHAGAGANAHVDGGSASGGSFVDDFIEEEEEMDG
eukprot:CAMPEP_0119352928 /NCGR_PEP_ID=MMETSP1334-20130426/2135_1 /TAXON_ID=127549 /ORGANISM="Calcidiscus leptoporus, Strain RCC1130" /LENGTH=391 /DNA_ID=CAMNT_0007366081 /DNA_START=16 /DNA_END=1191 /DNA_ORIENTATION=-